MVTEALAHYRARTEASRLLAEGQSPVSIVAGLESMGVPPAAAHAILHEAQQARTHAPVSAALRYTLAGSLWFAAGMIVLLLTYGLGQRGSEDLMVGVVLVYGLAVMTVGLVRAFRAGGEQDRSSVSRLFVLVLILALAGGGVAVKSYRKQADQRRLLASIAAHLENIEAFNGLEAELGERLERAGGDATSGLAVLRHYAPLLADYVSTFGDMVAGARVDGSRIHDRERLLLQAFGELAGLYMAEAGLYRELSEVVDLEPATVAWLRAAPILDSLDRSYGQITRQSETLRQHLDAP